MSAGLPLQGGKSCNYFPSLPLAVTNNKEVGT